MVMYTETEWSHELLFACQGNKLIRCAWEWIWLVAQDQKWSLVTWSTI